MQQLRFLVGPSPVLNDVGLLVLRLATAVVFIAHGWVLIFDAGVSNVIQNFREAGIPLAELSAPFTAYIELFGGILFVLGVLTRPLSAGFVIVMAGALFFVHLGEPLVSQDGESSGLAFVLCAASIALLLAGAGRFSIDHLLAQRVAVSSRSVGTTA